MAHVIELFVANHCPTCPEARVRIRDFAEATPDIVVVEHNIDEGLERAASYGLFATPAIVIDGQMVLYGVPTVAQLAARCRRARETAATGALVSRSRTCPSS